MPAKGARGGRGLKSPNRVNKTASPARATGSRQRSRSNSPRVQQRLEEAVGAQQGRTKLPKGRAMTQLSRSSSLASSPPATAGSARESSQTQPRTNTFKAVNAPVAQMADVAHMVADAITDGAYRTSDNSADNLPPLRHDESSEGPHEAQPTSSSSYENDETHNSSVDSNEEDDDQPMTAEEMVRRTYGDRPKIESAQCVKLAGEPARREPVQRRPGQKLNLDRRSNVEALLCHVVGTPAEQQCKNCRKGHGPWNSCVVHEGLMCNSCSNCWFNASGARCTFHVPDNSGNRQQGHGVPQGAPVAAQGQMQQRQSIPAPPPYLPRQQQAPVQTATQPVGFRNLSGGSAGQYRMNEGVHRAMSRGLNGAVVATHEERMLARIESAAQELGMRIAEYDEYLRTIHNPTAPTGAPASSAQNQQQQ
ncbi:hypothetical protein PLICBS_000608 [Purpureocillium lilacinum]|uniref:uncharacterized protein n=1 Tax=Purpureocillium lilacinum TaxID=33203 RepID=UPI0020815B2F|nr:hypothetical protein PLICBS_000608 [Purpureocillium lilacinum]